MHLSAKKETIFKVISMEINSLGTVTGETNITVLQVGKKVIAPNFVPSETTKSCSGMQQVLNTASTHLELLHRIFTTLVYS